MLIFFFLFFFLVIPLICIDLYSYIFLSFFFLFLVFLIVLALLVQCKTRGDPSEDIFTGWEPRQVRMLMLKRRGFKAQGISYGMRLGLDSL